MHFFKCVAILGAISNGYAMALPATPETSDSIVERQVLNTLLTCPHNGCNVQTGCVSYKGLRGSGCTAVTNKGSILNQTP